VNNIEEVSWNRKRERSEKVDREEEGKVFKENMLE